MKKLFPTSVRITLIVAVVITVLLIVISSLTGLSLPDMFVKGILTPIRTGASKLTENAQQLYSYIFEYESLETENALLKEQLSKLTEDARDAEAAARENERLRQLLGLSQANEDYTFTDAYIISRSSQDWSNTFTVNRGSNAGIQVGMCAITSNGQLVGLVSEVGGNYAVIKSILDSSLEISATIAASGYNGMVQGGYSTGLEGLLRMDYLPSSAVIRNNDEVVTSGSTVYPRGLIIGNVVDAGFDDTGVAKYALLKPAMELGSLEQVFIITDYQVD
ncbi:MAG: rod shape-determining protein MreC [Oscillospiraceae bacterium]|nr:rod shape-determining protein MreC [Oscillospiraceae bacterium]